MFFEYGEYYDKDGKDTLEFMKASCSAFTFVDVDSKKIIFSKNIINARFVDKNAKKIYDYITRRYPSFSIVAA